MHLKWKSHPTVALILAFLAGLDPTFALAGTIRGKVTLAGPFPFVEYRKAVHAHDKVEMKMLMMKAKMKAQGKKMEMEHCHDCTSLVRSIVVAEDRGLGNVVVVLKGETQRAARARTYRVSVQREATFVPHVMAVTRGTVIIFVNEDPFEHSIRSKWQARRFNLALTRRGITATVDFPRTGVVEMRCEFHEHMRGYVVVTDHPFFAVSDQRGEFVIRNVPPGPYTLEAWHERLGRLELDLSVPDGTVPVSVQYEVPGELASAIKKVAATPRAGKGGHSMGKGKMGH